MKLDFDTLNKISHLLLQVNLGSILDAFILGSKVWSDTKIHLSH